MYNHGFALALFVHDPEGNLIEIYRHTGREDFAPSYFGPLDLENQTEEGLRQLVAEMQGQRSAVGMLQGDKVDLQRRDGSDRSARVLRAGKRGVGHNMS